MVNKRPHPIHDEINVVISAVAEKTREIRKAELELENLLWLLETLRQQRNTGCYSTVTETG
jgi:hypothetical protein